MKVRLITMTLVIALLGLFVATPLTAGAAKPGPGKGSNPLAAVPITGTAPLNFAGTLNLTGFDVQNGVLVALGTVSGTLIDTADNIIKTFTNVPVTLPVTNVGGTCQILHLELGPVDQNLLGLMVHLDKVVLDITAQQGGGLLGDLLCGIANLLNNNTGLAALLNQILGILGGLTTSVTGGLTGIVSGTLNVTQFAVQNNQLMALGTFTGAITDGQGGTIASGTPQMAMPVNLAATSGSCQILHLTLGPVDLNLLGLMVHLDRVVLDITAQSGPGNLLGNLLCAVAHLLDGGNVNLNILANLLNQILAIL